MTKVFSKEIHKGCFLIVLLIYKKFEYILMYTILWQQWDFWKYGELKTLYPYLIQ